MFLCLFIRRCPEIKFRSDPRRSGTIPRSINGRRWWSSIEVKVVGETRGNLKKFGTMERIDGPSIDGHTVVFNH